MPQDVKTTSLVRQWHSTQLGIKVCCSMVLCFTAGVRRPDTLLKKMLLHEQAGVVPDQVRLFVFEVAMKVSVCSAVTDGIQ